MPDRTIPRVEEQAEIGKRVRTTGKVTVETVVRHETQPVEAELASETVEVRRVPIGRFVDGPVADRHEGDTLVVSVLEEVVVVEKRLRVVEEIHLTRRRTTRQIHDEVPVRREEVRIDRHES